MTALMNIGDAAKAAGVSAKMIRHYEQTGLLPEAVRSDSGYRLYGEREISVLRFIRQSRRLGFSMPQIAELIGQWGDAARSSRQVKAIAERHLQDLQQKLQEIVEMKSALEQLVAVCAGDDHADCAILDNLAVDSPSRPSHSANFVKPRRRSQNDSRSPAPGSVATSQLDLMAWMRGVHVHHGNH
ncbi:Cu(I)-responsive transcriptional regulator [Acidovorax soli]|uniref:Cu(I)-responsive transcriptional regulator n=1 Tax=Acidovorax soli TaxID=592050 RepID=A0A7X0U817_9BURK|nr:Cu(I)-responsive transcriptional regulator [Acidovorax soli]MBB6558737.1 Cu(I)-responsive transcriptional regulator [Acidovorax soli]